MSGDTIINHLMYADDLVLISPSATGMKELLCACEVYSLEHAIIYLEVFICVRSMFRIHYFVPFVLQCIHVACGGTIRHIALIS